LVLGSVYPTLLIVQAGIHKMPACFFACPSCSNMPSTRHPTKPDLLPLLFRVSRYALILASLMFPLAASGQLSPGATRDLGGPEEQFEVRPKSGIQLQAPAVRSVPLMLHGAALIERIRFEGLTAFSPSVLEPVVAPWLGKPLMAIELTALVDAITAFLRERGLYSAFAQFPEQDVTEGTAVIRIIEGRIGRVEIQQDTSRLRPAMADGFLSSLQPGSLIARGVLDTPLLLLNDLPGVVAQSSLQPGAAPGTADLSVRIDDQPMVAGFVRIDNHQIRELGEYELTGHLRLRSPLGLGDLATAEVVRSHTGGRTRGALTYSLPVSYLGTRLGGLYSNQRYRIGGAFEPLLATGDFDRFSAVVTHPFVRRDNANLGGSFAATSVDYHDRIDAVGFSRDSRHRFGTARLSGDRADTFWGGGSTAFYLEYQAGDVSLRPPAVAAADSATLDAAGWFGRTRVYLERNQAMTARSSVFAAWTAQFASKNLDLGREIELTGHEGVRAYPAGELIVDEGHLIRIEYRHALPIGEVWRTQGALFVDGARGRLNRNPLPGVTGNTRELWGYGLSVLAARNGLNAQVTLAWRGSKAPLTAPGRNPRFWFALTQYF